ncbi:RecD/TraA family helicase [Enterococcus sulfureus ATCC 49903]|uniref:ATP-dependent RecD2 DNA helicase n=1 Tax=Enterococcus sulfureus ATCC 49903 TaxID=1140003 RepID=S0LDR5_9ENTE|nr:ATP-dependent RecD-like DNA helicase [Enterococcus sulfureus]EOT51465.1 RecD/TraA family helicase [Enterococcus sulfureus ATCC 49903]EOT87122.1 RecD/TraA family helicase [Enterococcus sulfureus ATCC 49903]
MPEKEVFIGKVAAIFYQNPTNFYKVLLVKVDETTADYREKEIVVTGSFGDVQEEETYRFHGQLVEHPKYGKQLSVETYQKEQPTSAAGIVHYLSSDKFPGIGKKTAQTIVDAFGEQAIEKILEDPSLLQTLPHLNKKKRDMIVETLRLNHGMDQVIVGLTEYGFGSRLSFAIYQKYRNEALEIIQENPYQLVEDIEGIGFKKADLIAEQLGITPHANARIKAALFHQLMQVSIQTGDTYVQAKRLLEQTISLLETSRPVEMSVDQVADGLIELVEEGKVYQEGTAIYEKRLYFSEIGIAQSIHRLMKRKQAIKFTDKELDQTFKKVEKELGIRYGASQEEAIKEAIRSPFFMLTGGPGTGKTTVINGIVHMFAHLHEVELDPSQYTSETFPILLAAPTGRAAKRMNETTGLPSGTIHRLLGLNNQEQDIEMETKELEGGLLIVDEMSMVDTWLANTLFKALSTNMQIILVGDKDQLPSVGPGQVLHDLLQTPFLPKYELTEIYRQGDGSSVISLAHEIKNGRLPQDFTQNQSDRSFFACDAYQIEPIIAQIVQKAKAKGFTAQDIQILAPMYKGAAGVDALNKMMQEIFNPNDGRKKEVKFNDTVYRIGDKVLQLVNSPEDNVFNGDMGQIVGIVYAKDSEDKVDELVIQFDANEVTYRRNDWQKITLSYCCTIHKSQGSEFKMVILPMVQQYQRMLQRNLLYTAITRSKEKLILLGEVEAYARCVQQESNLRATTLKERLLEVEGKGRTLAPPSTKEVVENHADKVEETTQDYASESKESILTLELIESRAIDPMIGMGDVRPQEYEKTNDY